MVSVLMISSFSSTAQPVLILLPCPLVWSVFHQFVYEHVMEQSVEILVKAKINNTKCSLLLPQALSYKDTSLIRRQFPFINHADYTLYSFLFFICLETISRRICSIKFPGTEVRLTIL